MSNPALLPDTDLSLLRELAQQQAQQPQEPLPLLELAVKRLGFESEARHVLQRLLVHGLIELAQDDQARRRCLGVVTDRVALPLR
jgi:hypothetical protein